ncbi:MAG: 2,3-bisphosphoglycerate-independent phosphoglycerate mutase [Bacteroidetes bacterium]|nr:2,3-bisphosphoglycerate-independent phosphoglycerate mutase [Bacteroidota bacterium]
MKKAILLILDGWGIGKGDKTDAIACANTPFTDSLYQKYPNTTLTTFGNAVGLPEGQMGNSEVGHMNIGAGRVVWQMLERINRAFKHGDASQNHELNKLFDYCKSQNKPLHLLGLVSSGGVHSSLEHLFGLIDLAHKTGVKQVYIHAFTDGRDTDPKSSVTYLQNLLDFIEDKPNTKLASIIGRYYAMDRDKRWERIKLAYDLIVNAEGTKSQNPISAIKNQYEAGVTDEFLKPIILCDSDNQAITQIHEEDAVLFFNFRTDRGRQLTRVLTQEDFPDFGMKKLKLRYATMTEYEKDFKNISIIFDNQDIPNTLGEFLSNKGFKQIRGAETEKYPHVTFFFSGGREEIFENEKRILINSPKVATYDLQPEMSAIELKKAVIEEIKKGETDFFCVNFANPDMVGHTGVFSAIVKAVETVDSCVKEIVNEAFKQGYTLLITADHGNADNAVNPDGTPNTAHSINPVPIWLVSEPAMNVKMHKGVLADIAPSILKVMGLEQPKEMTGNALF